MGKSKTSKQEHLEWLTSQSGLFQLVPHPAMLARITKLDSGHINNMYRQWVKSGHLIQPFGKGGPYALSYVHVEDGGFE